MLLKIIKELSKGAGYKVDIQKSVVFLYASNNQKIPLNSPGQKGKIHTYTKKRRNVAEKLKRRPK